MSKQDKIWLFGAAAVLIILGEVLIRNNHTPGWFLIILGAAYLGISTGIAQKWVASK